MEERDEVNKKCATDNACTTEEVNDQPDEATGETSSQLSSAKSASKQPGAAAQVGSRLKLFNKVMEKSLGKFIDDASFHRFTNAFQPLYKKDPGLMKSIHKQFIIDLQRTVKADIDRVIEEGQLQVKLDDLDKLERAANSTDPAWRPTGVPEEDLCSFVMPYYQKQEAYLRRELKKIQRENAALAQGVQAGRECIAQTELRIATAADEWKESVREYQKLAPSLCPVDTFDV
ncbi:polyamine-modulated factor 1 [Lampris incognitus]|uniref:polyamine-modulated factor 1 n=1 Tax=Lampris incognitus TaxID=2546036 RepID=UPI0024B61275|nr:polyamine-modulated factor 1 [Lampris incognitus]